MCKVWLTCCFPWGFYAAPICDPCASGLHLTAFTVTPYSQELSACQVEPDRRLWQDPSPRLGNDGEQVLEAPVTSTQQLGSLAKDTVEKLTLDLDGRLPDNDLVCVACGCGDCTVGHWVHHRIIPIVAAHRLLCLRRFLGSLDRARL